MIALEVTLDKLKKEYPNFYEFFKNTLNNSNSKYKDYNEDKYKCYYYVGFYMKPSQKTEEYYENLYKLKWDERLIEEYSKSRLTITMVAGKFAISDQTNEISESVKPILNEIISRKMYYEQKYFGFKDMDIYNSIPNIEELKIKIEKEIEKEIDFLEYLGIDTGTSVKRQSELSPQDRLKKLIEEEKYEDAEELINQYPELKKNDNKNE